MATAVDSTHPTAMHSLGPRQTAHGQDTPPPGQTPPRQTLQRKLRILLDCILVAYACIIFYILYLLFYSPPVGWICSISVWHLLHFCVQIISDPVEAEKTYGCAS